MSRKGKIIITTAVIVLLFILSGAALIFIPDSSIRNKIPARPDFKLLSKPVRNQINSALLKAYFFPNCANLGNLGLIYYSCAHQDKASDCFKLAVQKSKREWIWNYFLGYLNLEQGDSKSAIENFKTVIAKNPGNYLAVYYMGEACQNLGLERDAELLFKRVAATEGSIYEKTNRESYFPLQTYAQFRLSRIYMNSNRLDSAEATLKEIIKKQWTFGPAYRLLGNVYNNMGNAVLGDKFITRAGDLSEFIPPQDTLIDRIAFISRSEKYLLKAIEDAKTSCNFNLALKLCDYSLKCIPDDKYLISNYILISFILGKNADVLPSFLDQHLKNFSDDYDELSQMPDLLYNNGFKEEALKYFEQAKKLQPLNSMHAIWLSRWGRNAEALALISDQLKKDPENERTLTDAVHIYLNLGEKEKTLTYLSRLKRLYPSSLEAKKATGLLFEMDGKLKEAMSLYEEISKDKQKDLAIYKYLQSVYVRNKMWDKAILNFTTGLKNFPNDPELLEGLGWLLISCPDVKRRNVELGREYAERAYINVKSLAATKVYAVRELATAYAFLGDKSRAAFFMDVTIDLANRGNFPRDEYISYFKALCKEYGIN